jgi:hypothetical protein
MSWIIVRIIYLNVKEFDEPYSYAKDCNAASVNLGCWALDCKPDKRRA